MLNLAEGLIDRGHKVDILVEKAVGELLCQVPERCAVVVIQTSNHPDEPNRFFNTRSNWACKRINRSINSILCRFQWKVKRLLPRVRLLLSIWMHGCMLAIRKRAPIRSLLVYTSYMSQSLDPSECKQKIHFILDYIDRTVPDCVITGLEQQNFRMILASLLSKQRPVCLASVRNHLSSFWDLYGYTSFHEWGIKNLYGHSDAIICVSRMIRSDLIERFGIPGSKCRVIYNPVVSDVILQRGNDPTEDDDWLCSNIPVILAVGRLHYQKGFDILIKAFAKATACQPARLIILGVGDQAANLLDTALSYEVSESIRLPGFKTNPYAYMSKASVFVLSSRNEGLPGVLIQAMACGCRVISTDCPSGPREILEDGKWGRLVPVDDINALSEAIVESLSEETNPFPSISRANDFSVEKSVSEYLATVGRLSLLRSLPHNH